MVIGLIYDVFVSFHGEDTRYNFTGNLCNALDRKGIHTFKDDIKLKKEGISPELLKAIEESRIAIIVFSENCASSTWYLDELVKIMECMKERTELVRPVFYSVDSSEVRHQRGSFKSSMEKHEANPKYGEKRTSKWRIALAEAANLSGWHFKKWGVGGMDNRHRVGEGNDEEEELLLDTIESVHRVDYISLSGEEVEKYEFADLDMPYAFYNLYGKSHGFGIRKHKVGRSVSDNQILWQTFVCSRQGHREAKYVENSNRRREPKPLTRCGCQAQLRVHSGSMKNRWYVTKFDDDRNHDLLSPDYCRFLWSHRNMGGGDILRFNSMRKAGVSPPKIYGLFASQAGGFDKVGFRKKDMYNRIKKDRQLGGGDANNAIGYFHVQEMLDPLFFWRHELDEQNRMRQLFWSNGRGQVDYELFGDVLAFDATYGKNKYKCLVVVFSGVNHHLQTIVFGCGVVSNESERTYVWLLEKFVEAMKGKSPKSVIMDGDLSMKNATRMVFPDAKHRLCGWHLIRNATSNVAIPRFTQEFKMCLLGDYDVNEFEQKWAAMVRKFGV